MTRQTSLHGWTVPTEGDKNYADSFNDFFVDLDTNSELRDVESNLQNYSPKSGAKFVATDTENEYIGDGTTWNKLQTSGKEPSFDSVETQNYTYTQESSTGDLVVEKEGSVIGRYTESDSSWIFEDLTDSSGDIQPQRLPDLAITSTFVVADKSARLALDAEEGDVAIQTDVSTTYILTTEDPTQDANWSAIQLDVLGAIDGNTITPNKVGKSSNTVSQIYSDSLSTESASITNGLSAGSVETPSVATTSRNGIEGVNTSVPSGSATTIYQKVDPTASAILIVTGSSGGDSFADIVAYNSNSIGEAVYQTDDGEIRASERSYSVANGYEVQLTQTTGGDLNTSVVSIGIL